MDKKLIFLDIDGTLTPAGTNVPPESAVSAIKKAQENGHKVFLCTGRNLDMLSPLLVYGFDGIVASAGGYVTCGDEVIFDCPMTESQLERAMRLLGENGVFRTIEAKDATFGDENLGEFLANAGEGNSELVRWRKALAEKLNIKPMGEYDDRPIYKVVVMCLDWEQLEPARAELESEFDFCIQDLAARGCLNGELINRKFSKGTGVKLAAERLGFDMKDTIGFGDSMNDLDMIKVVGTSVCMDNGSPQLKEMSNMVCPSVEDDGLYDAFLKLGLI